jgi:3-methyladenine DNA glycosylase AlkC
MSRTMLTKISDVAELVKRGRSDPESVFGELKRLAASAEWQTREVAATVLVRIAEKHPDAVIKNALRWAKDRDPNVRRAASEGLRGVVKSDPEGVGKVITLLREDSDLYVKKSVANVLRNASVKQKDFVLKLCGAWVRSSNPNTRWIVKDGLRKLKATGSSDVAKILRLCESTGTQ